MDRASLVSEDRSFGMLEVRSVDEAKRTFIGVANSERQDSHGTWIEPEGAVYTLPVPLFYHDRGEHAYIPFGEVIRSWVEGGKRWVEAHVPRIADDGTPGSRSVRDRLDAHWTEVKSGLVRGLSIDFQPLDPPRATRGTRVKKWAWRGLTVVPIPSNMDASVVSVRSILAASGDSAVTPPGVSGTPNQSKPRRPMKTYAERIAALENKRAANVARMEAISQKVEDEGRTKDEAEQEEFTTLHNEVTAVDTELVDVRALEKLSARAATPVAGTSTAAASQSRGGAVIAVKPNVEPGILMARHVMALAACKGVRADAAEYAKETWGDAADELILGLRRGLMHTRTAVAPGTTAQATFAAPLVQTNYVNDFLELLRPKTLLGRIPGLRKVPFNTSMPAQTAGGTYKWVGQGKMKPVTNAQYASVTLAFAKAAGIIVLTEELVRLSTPSAEAAVRDELVKGMQQFLDGQFVDSSVAAVSNVNPASITNGVTGTAASGTDVSDARSDISARIAAFAAAGYPLGDLVILMSESQAFALGSMLNSVGNAAFPGLTINGGSILGVPVVTSETVGSQIIFASASSILYADDGGVEIDVSREASVELNDTPTEPSDASTVLTSLWQANLVGIKAERFITWGKARSTAVDRITSAAYVA